MYLLARLGTVTQHILMEEMNRAFFITGVESGGNHITTRFFCEAGCFGTWNQHQVLDEYILGKKDLKDIDGDIVYNRPTGGRFPNLADIDKKLNDNGYDVIWVVPIRDTRMVSASRKARGMTGNGKAERRHIVENYRHIQVSMPATAKRFKFAMRLIYKEPHKFIALLKDKFGLVVPDTIIKHLYDGDAKYEEVSYS